jgi:hypothetical protein
LWWWLMVGPILRPRRVIRPGRIGRLLWLLLRLLLRGLLRVLLGVGSLLWVRWLVAGLDRGVTHAGRRRLRLAAGRPRRNWNVLLLTC